MRGRQTDILMILTDDCNVCGGGLLLWTLISICFCASALLPSAPTDVNVTGTATSATVYWKKPAVIHDSYQVVGYALYWTDTEDVDSTDVHVVSAVSNLN